MGKFPQPHLFKITIRSKTLYKVWPSKGGATKNAINAIKLYIKGVAGIRGGGGMQINHVFTCREAETITLKRKPGHKVTIMLKGHCL